ncbi:class I adenylate-forming enzyme family protein [Pseudonocardia sp. GCM10023141]|uniref:class I adenylate-forming enzyme family protein n=1 Tax=Pseudonocardia sp. GCM10023141 TaxID=3252653 RepID=UPI003622606A
MLRTDLIRTVPDLLRHHAELRPAATAFLDEHRSITYGELDASTARLAGHLQRLGLARGDRALILVDNRVEVAEAYLAIPRAGGIAVCVNPASAPAEIAHVLDDSGARIVLTDAAHRATVQALAADGRRILVIDEARYAELLTAESEPPRNCLELDDPAWMLYTSGTTGRPKGVYLTQRGCLWVVAACFAPILGLGPDDVVLSPLPLFHSYALVLCVLAVVAVGATERILPRFSVQEVLAHLRAGTATVFPGVPTMFQYLLDRLDGEPLDAPGLRVCMSAGAIMPAALNTAFEYAAGVPLLDGYGITETSTMVTMNWSTGERVPGSCGLPLPGLTVRLVDPGTGVDALPGAEGELWVQGPNVTPGYHNLPDATAAVLVDGWYRTGDLGRRDEHGFLRISGRTKELIIRGGENIYPAEVEAAIMATGVVKDAAVVAAPHRSLGEVPVAFVVAPDGVDHSALLAACADRLAPYKMPAQVIEIDAIPRTGSGKILRFRLQEQLSGRKADSGADR